MGWFRRKKVDDETRPIEVPRRRPAAPAAEPLPPWRPTGGGHEDATELLTEDVLPRHRAAAPPPPPAAPPPQPPPRPPAPSDLARVGRDLLETEELLMGMLRADRPADALTALGRLSAELRQALGERVRYVRMMAYLRLAQAEEGELRRESLPLTLQRQLEGPLAPLLVALGDTHLTPPRK